MDKNDIVPQLGPYFGKLSQELRDEVSVVLVPQATKDHDINPHQILRHVLMVADDEPLKHTPVALVCKNFHAVTTSVLKRDYIFTIFIFDALSELAVRLKNSKPGRGLVMKRSTYFPDAFNMTIALSRSKAYSMKVHIFPRPVIGAPLSLNTRVYMVVRSLSQLAWVCRRIDSHDVTHPYATETLCNVRLLRHSNFEAMELGNVESDLLSTLRNSLWNFPGISIDGAQNEVEAERTAKSIRMTPPSSTEHLFAWLLSRVEHLRDAVADEYDYDFLDIVSCVREHVTKWENSEQLQEHTQLGDLDRLNQLLSRLYKIAFIPLLRGAILRNSHETGLPQAALATGMHVLSHDADSNINAEFINLVALAQLRNGDVNSALGSVNLALTLDSTHIPSRLTRWKIRRTEHTPWPLWVLARELLECAFGCEHDHLAETSD